MRHRLNKINKTRRKNISPCQRVRMMSQKLIILEFINQSKLEINNQVTSILWIWTLIYCLFSNQNNTALSSTPLAPNKSNKRFHRTQQESRNCHKKSTSYPSNTSNPSIHAPRKTPPQPINNQSSPNWPNCNKT